MRLNEAGLLRQLDRISSVSGGSIAAAVLGLNWNRLDFNASGVGLAFDAQVVRAIRGIASRTIDWQAILGGLLMPGNASDRLARAYAKHLIW